MSQRHAPLSSPKLYALGVPPKKVVWVLPLWLADYVRGLVGLVGS